VKSIGVFALNPAIDAEWQVDDVLWEEKNTVHSQRRWAGGKGVNVARWLHFLRADAGLVIPLGGETGRELETQLRAEHITTRVVPLRESTRVNVIVTTAHGRQMRFNPAGPRLRATEWRAILDVVRDLAGARTAPACLVLSGSLPPGAPVDAYAQIIRLARRRGVRVLLDCDGPAFAAAVREHPFLVKPNAHELSLWAGRELRSAAAIGRAARELSAATGHWVLVSMGADGALLVNEPESSYARASAPRVRTLTTVGTGDALLAAVAGRLARGAAPIEWLRHAVATGTAATQFDGGRFPGRSLIGRLLRQVPVQEGSGD
jgi:1-phosphofructokinase family hexose kinase